VPGRCCLQESIAKVCGESASKIQTWAEAELLFASWRRYRLWSRTCCCCRFRSSGGVLLAVATVIRVAGSLLLRTVPAHLTGFRLRGDLLAVILIAAAPLVTGIAADWLG
jgi:hypothetical protein